MPINLIEGIFFLSRSLGSTNMCNGKFVRAETSFDMTS